MVRGDKGRGDKGTGRQGEGRQGERQSHQSLQSLLSDEQEGDGSMMPCV